MGWVRYGLPINLNNLKGGWRPDHHQLASCHQCPAGFWPYSRQVARVVVWPPALARILAIFRPSIRELNLFVARTLPSRVYHMRGRQLFKARSPPPSPFPLLIVHRRPCQVKRTPKHLEHLNGVNREIKELERKDNEVRIVYFLQLLYTPLLTFNFATLYFICVISI